MERKSIPGINVSSLYLLIIVVSLFSSCTGESNMMDGNNSKLLNFSVSVPSWSNAGDNASKAETRAAPMAETSFSTSYKFNLYADQYDGSSSYTKLIDNESVSYSNSNSMWQTDAPYYWSGTSSKTINFYAYYPTGISTNITHTTAGTAPILDYTVPDDVAKQPDVIVATTSAAGNTNAAATLSFNHIFAAVNFSVGGNGLGSGTISSISIGNVAYSGTYTFGSGWSNVTGSKTFTISQSKTIAGTSGEDLYSGTYTLMMIPQTISNVTITITYSNGGSLTKTISGTWLAGNTYNYKLSFIREYNYTGSVQTFTAPITGTYKLEVWGAQGGGPSSSSVNGGKGAYVIGTVSLVKNSVLYIYVGQQPSAGTGGWNGGGSNLTASYGGGGATDISLNNGSWNTTQHLYSRIIVAGGGGGYGAETSANVCQGGYGGAWNGGNGIGDDPGYGATISAIGANSSTTANTNQSSPGFGYGGSSSWYLEGLGAGGGGWYGGGCAGGSGYNGSGGGGSSYAWTSSLASYYPSSSYKPSTSYYLSNVSCQAGVRSGNGYARITFVSAN